MLRECVECGMEFDPTSKEKRKVGGLSTNCVMCSEETSVKYAGVAGADGKMASIQVLKFESEEDRKKYLQFWKNNSGLYKSKSCQIGRGLSTTPNTKFTIVAENIGNANHKGKA